MCYSVIDDLLKRLNPVMIICRIWFSHKFQGIMAPRFYLCVFRNMVDLFSLGNTNEVWLGCGLIKGHQCDVHTHLLESPNDVTRSRCAGTAELAVLTLLLHTFPTYGLLWKTSLYIFWWFSHQQPKLNQNIKMEHRAAHENTDRRRWGLVWGAG